MSAIRRSHSASGSAASSANSSSQTSPRLISKGPKKAEQKKLSPFFRSSTPRTTTAVGMDKPRRNSAQTPAAPPPTNSPRGINTSAKGSKTPAPSMPRSISAAAFLARSGSNRTVTIADTKQASASTPHSKATSEVGSEAKTTTNRMDWSHIKHARQSAASTASSSQTPRGPSSATIKPKKPSQSEPISPAPARRYSGSSAVVSNRAPMVNLASAALARIQALKASSPSSNPIDSAVSQSPKVGAHARKNSSDLPSKPGSAASKRAGSVSPSHRLTTKLPPAAHPAPAPAPEAPQNTPRKAANKPAAKPQAKQPSPSPTNSKPRKDNPSPSSSTSSRKQVPASSPPPPPPPEEEPDQRDEDTPPPPPLPPPDDDSDTDSDVTAPDTSASTGAAVITVSPALLLLSHHTPTAPIPMSHPLPDDPRKPGLHDRKPTLHSRSSLNVVELDRPQSSQSPRTPRSASERNLHITVISETGETLFTRKPVASAAQGRSVSSVLLSHHESDGHSPLVLPSLNPPVPTLAPAPIAAKSAAVDSAPKHAPSSGSSPSAKPAAPAPLSVTIPVSNAPAPVVVSPSKQQSDSEQIRIALAASSRNNSNTDAVKSSPSQSSQSVATSRERLDSLGDSGRNVSSSISLSSSSSGSDLDLHRDSRHHRKASSNIPLFTGMTPKSLTSSHSADNPAPSPPEYSYADEREFRDSDVVPNPTPAPRYTDASRPESDVSLSMVEPPSGTQSPGPMTITVQTTSGPSSNPPLSGLNIKLPRVNQRPPQSSLNLDEWEAENRKTYGHLLPSRNKMARPQSSLNLDEASSAGVQYSLFNPQIGAMSKAEFQTSLDDTMLPLSSLDVDAELDELEIEHSYSMRNSRTMPRGLFSQLRESSNVSLDSDVDSFASRVPRRDSYTEDMKADGVLPHRPVHPGGVAPLLARARDAVSQKWLRVEELRKSRARKDAVDKRTQLLSMLRQRRAERLKARERFTSSTDLSVSALSVDSDAQAQ